MKSKYLPIGTICEINKNNKKVMIIGYCTPEFRGNLKINDYIGCVYPEGVLLPNQIVAFNHSDILEVVFVGYKNEEQNRLNSLLNDFTGTDKVEIAKNFHDDNEMFLTSNKAFSKLLFDENGVVMIAEKNQTNGDKYEFDENGYVININNEDVFENPFSKKIEVAEEKEELSKNWSIFNKIEFDEDGNVIEVEEKKINSQNHELSPIEFDENGVVVAVVGENLLDSKKVAGLENLESTQQKNVVSSNYSFDANGNVVSEETYEFDAAGNLVSTTNTLEEIPAIGPGLPGYEEPKNETSKKTSKKGRRSILQENLHNEKQTIESN